MAGEPALALAQPFAGVLGAVAPIFGVSQAAQAVDEFLAHLLGDDGGAWLAHS